MHRVIAVVAASLLAGPIAAGPAPAAPSADEIVLHNVEARGGAAHLKAITAIGENPVPCCDFA